MKEYNIYFEYHRMMLLPICTTKKASLYLWYNILVLELKLAVKMVL